MELQARGSRVGVSVLCPGFVRTRIAESSRNQPAALREAMEGVEVQGEMEELVKAIVAAGIDPSVVAERVAEAVEGNEFWVFPHRHVAIRTTEQRLEWM